MSSRHTKILEKISSLNAAQQRQLELFVDYLSKFNLDKDKQEGRDPLFEEFNKNLGETMSGLLKVNELIGSPELFENLVTSVDSVTAKKYDKDRVGKYIRAHLELCRTIQSLILLCNYAGPTKKTLNVVEQGFDFKSGSYTFSINPFIAKQ